MKISIIELQIKITNILLYQLPKVDTKIIS